jgi:hypothetical protein
MFMDDAMAILEEVTSLLETLTRVPIDTVPDDELCLFTVQLEQAGRFVDTLRARSAAEIDERSRFELGRDGLSWRLGQRRSVHLIEQLTRVSGTTAAARIRLGAAIRPRTALDGRPLPAEHPHVADAMNAGELGTDAAAQIVRALDQAARHTVLTDALDPTEHYLVRVAATESADLVAVQARVQREVLDPDGAPQRDEELRARRRFALGREAHGLTAFSGACDPASAALLRTAFAESIAPDALPRFLSEEDRLAATESIEDPRTREQRQLDVLMGLVTAGLRSTGMRSTAAVTAVITLSDLELGRGVGWLDDIDEPVSAETIRELVCDAGFRRMILGNDGEPLAQGRLERFFTPAQRRALAVRDGGCVWPQCTAPPGWCHAHHVKEWHAGGETDVDNGVLLCPAHHHMLHDSSFTIEMAEGVPRLLAPPWIDPEQEWRRVGRSRVAMVRQLECVGGGSMEA